MRKRKLCMAALIFLLIHIILQWKTGELSGGVSRKIQDKDSCTLTLLGTVSRRECSNKYHIYYLSKFQTASASKPISNQKIIIYYPREEHSEKKEDVSTGGAEGTPEEKIFSPQVGNRIRVKGRLDLFDTAVNPGMFDQRDYYRKRGIVACIWADSAEVLDEESFWAGEFLCKLSISWNRMLDAAIGEENGELLSAMLFGEKNDLDTDTKEVYRLSGIGHVLAISGVKTLKLDIPLVPETRINWAFVPLHIAIIYILKLCLDEEIIPRCRFPCSRGYFTKCINWQKKQ